MCFEYKKKGRHGPPKPCTGVTKKASWSPGGVLASGRVTVGEFNSHRDYTYTVTHSRQQ